MIFYEMENRQLNYAIARIQPLVRFRATLRSPIICLVLVCAVLALVCVGPAWAQDSPRVQAFGGYSFLSFNSQPFGFTDRSNLNGFTLAPSYNLTHEFGITAQLSGQYGSQLSIRNLTVGPQILFTRGNSLFFAHLLIGKGRTFVKVGHGAGDSARAFELGGGLDLGLSSHFSWRAIQADYVHNSFFKSSQNSVRLSTGIVYHLGGVKKHRRPSLSD